MIDSLRDELSRMDMEARAVVQFYVKAETYGTEGHVLETEKKVREVKEDILVALGMAPILVTDVGSGVSGLALDKDFIYWTVDYQYGSVGKRPLAGGADVRVAEAALTEGKTYGAGVVVDNNNIYWADGSQIYKIAK
jgi:hypothetical protein